MYDKEKLINLYLEQIKYLRQENISIQDKFLTSIGLPLSLLGVMVYYIETNIGSKDISFFYLFLPFLFFLIPYNNIKYSIRMLGINGYIKYLENRINTLLDDKVFFWNTRLLNTGLFGGFAVVTSIAQIPIYVACFIFLGEKYIEVQNEGTYFVKYYFLLNFLLVIFVVAFILMLLDAIFIQKLNLKKLDLNVDTVGLKDIIDIKEYFYKIRGCNIRKK